MTFKMDVDEHDRFFTLSHAGQRLFRYVYNPETAPVEAPRPYFHPLWTLAGDKVSIFRPHDHRWHHGLSMVFAHINGENFWGGVTYVHGQGYVQLDNVGRQRHDGWTSANVNHNGYGCHLTEALTWLTHDQREWIRETRLIAVPSFNKPSLLRGDYWTLELRFKLTNMADVPLTFGSPTTQGRPKAGYGGLFWRGRREFTGGQILLSDGRSAAGDEDAVMGERSPWLAFIGQHDGVDRASTMMFIDTKENIRYPTQWFTRTGNFACASASFMFDTEYTLAPGETLDLGYRVVIGNGAWSRDRIEEVYNRLTK